MYLLGILSIVQAIFLPGLLATYQIKNFRWIDRALLAIPLSIVINYVLVVILTLAHVYNQAAMLLVVLIEILALLTICLKDYRKPNWSTPVALIELPAFSKMRFIERVIYFVLGLAIIFVANQAQHQLGTVFSEWDAIVSWNRWAVSWFHGEFPVMTWTYPQGMPILYSITYQFIGDERVQFFAKAIAIVLPLAAIASILRMAFLIEHARAILILSIPIFVILLSKGYVGDGSGSFMFSGYADTPIAYFGVLACYVFTLLLHGGTRGEVKTPDSRFIYVAIVIISATALIKQTGVLVAILFPLAWFYYCGRNRSQQEIIRLIGLYIIVAMLAGTWYVYKGLQIFNGQETSSLSAYNALIPAEWYERPLSAAKLFFNTYGWFWLVPFAVGLRYPAIRALALWAILPVFLFWALVVSYDLRGLYIALPWIAITLSAGCYAMYEFIRSKPLYFPLILVWLVDIFWEVKERPGYMVPTGNLILYAALFILIILSYRFYFRMMKNFGSRKVNTSLASMLCLATAIFILRVSSPEATQDLITKSITDQQQIVEPNLNELLLKRFSEDGGQGKLATEYQPAAFIPGMKDRVKGGAPCDNLSLLADPEVRYILFYPACTPSQQKDFEKAAQGTGFRKIFEGNGSVLYEINRPTFSKLD